MSSSKEKTKHPPSAEAPPVPEPACEPVLEDAPEATAPSAATAPPPVPTVPHPPAPIEAPLTAEQLQALKAKADKADEHWDRLLRAKADLDNYKKRAARERHDAVRFANLALMEKLIPALDSFDMALTAVSQASGNGLEPVKTGLALVHSQIKSTLTEAGLQEIDATQQPFDPNVHEAVSQQESADVSEGHVLHQLRKGYRLHERLIRPATVVVARKPTA